MADKDLAKQDVSQNEVLTEKLDLELQKVRSKTQTGEVIEYYQFIYWFDRDLDIKYIFKLNDKYKVAFDQLVKFGKLHVKLVDETK